MTRFWADGLAITVSCDALATPTAFTWQDQRHVITPVRERWRIDVGWWHRRTWREYFPVITHTGLLLEIYHDVRTGQWYLQRVYD